MTTAPASLTASATADATGGVSFRFEAPRTGMVRVCSISIPGAVSTTVIPITWQAKVGPFSWGRWYNDQSSGPIQQNDTLFVTGAGLTAGTTYTAFLSGFDTDQPSSILPQPTPAPPPSSPVVLHNSFVGAADSITGGLAFIPVAYAPVIIGTSTLLSVASVTNNMRVTLQWSSPTPGGGASLTAQETINIAAGNALQGYVRPNYDQQLSVIFQEQFNGSERIYLVTGLAPVTPSAESGTGFNGVLFSISTTFANGNNAYALPPFTGEALLSAKMAGAVGTFDAEVIFTDYVGANLGAVTMVSSQVTRGFSVIPPTRLYLPPVIATLNLNNNTGGVALGTASVVAGSR